MQQPCIRRFGGRVVDALRVADVAARELRTKQREFADGGQALETTTWLVTAARCIVSSHGRATPSPTQPNHDWPARIADARGRRVVLLAHCLLNENVRYPGGACCAGAVCEIAEACLARGIGMVQLPCPEQHAWGGVLKPRLLRFFGRAGGALYRFRKLLLPVMLWYTRRVYGALARRAAREIADNEAAGIDVLAIVGVDGSPSCGVRTSLDVAEALTRLGRLDPSNATADAVNGIVRATAVPGTGIFVERLQRELTRRRLSVPFIAHDLIAEIEGRPADVEVVAALGPPSHA